MFNIVKTDVFIEARQAISTCSPLSGATLWTIAYCDLAHAMPQFRELFGCRARIICS